MTDVPRTGGFWRDPYWCIAYPQKCLNPCFSRQILIGVYYLWRFVYGRWRYKKHKTLNENAIVRNKRKETPLVPG